MKPAPDFTTDPREEPRHYQGHLLRDFAKQEVEILADYLGLTPHHTLDTKGLGTYLDSYWGRLVMAERQAVFFRFAVAYLPLIADRIVDLDETGDSCLWDWINGYIAALEAIQKHATPYLMNYLRSDHPDNMPVRLTRRLGERICHSLIKHDIMEDIGDIEPGSLGMAGTTYHGIFDLLLFLLAYLPNHLQHNALMPHDQGFLIIKCKMWGPKFKRYQDTSKFSRTFVRTSQTRLLDADDKAVK
ncbi:hypothetical protein CALCODRAFT_180461 [Calocera cornea HHB12733]|uniref:Uncharacterized protein n=1 Tax=Calocera cornea HHB12733 TaxID=1353952 RepID=A0A165CCE1_9BASI|nr:hypothetical protein CALCODRAFT_180461 [Calocera cornea HHB12733]